MNRLMDGLRDEAESKLSDRLPMGYQISDDEWHEAEECLMASVRFKLRLNQDISFEECVELISSMLFVEIMKGKLLKKGA